MTKGRAALPATVVAEQDPVETHFQEETAENADLSIRCAPVEMTKGRTALPATVVAEQDPVENIVPRRDR